MTEVATPSDPQRVTNVASGIAREVQTHEQAAVGEALTLVFDGGSLGNPGQGYGSFAFIPKGFRRLNWPGQPPEVHRLRFGPRMTNNEAEYDTLIAALEALLNHLESMGEDPAQVHLEVRGDSQLVVNQLNGLWRVREERLRGRWQKTRALLRRFGQTVIQYQPRERSVAVLGH
jgi:ribonuclease HI